MDNQQPGQTISPQPNNGSDGNEANRQQNGSGQEAPKPQTPEEINQIDSAMEGRMQAQEAEPEEPEITETPQPPQPQPQPQPPATNESETQNDNTDSQATDSGQEFSRRLDAAQTETETDTDPQPVMSWQAAEPAESFGGTRSLLAIGIVAVIVVVGVFIFGGINFSSIFGTLVVALGLVALVIANRRPGHMEEYSIYAEGVSIGKNFYPFSDIKAFSIVSNGGAENVELIPAKRFMPTLSLYLDPSSAESIVDTLSQHLPLEERQPDMLDRISRRLKM